MGYQITVDGQRNPGLHPWLTAMTGNTVDVRHGGGSVRGRGHTVSGSIVRTGPPGPKAEVTLVSVDVTGKPLDGGMLMHIEIEDITEVAVW